MPTENSIPLSIIIPVYNEADNVEFLYQEIVSSLDKEYLYEVIYVDDGSTDGTKERLLTLEKEHEQLKVVCHNGNFGQSAALVSGARAAQYPLLVTMDGDGQNDPADIPTLYKQMHASNRVVLGIRQKRDDSLLKKISSRVGNTVRRWILNDGCPDTGCSLKLFPRQAFLQLPHFNHMHRYLPALFKNAGFQLISVKVNHRSRKHGVSKYGVMNRLFVGIHDLIGVRWLLKRTCLPEVSHEN